MASTIAFQVTQGGFSNLNKTYNLSDADMVRVIAAYQSAANTSVNGTATRVQVLSYWLSLIIQSAKDAVKSIETQAAVAAITPVVDPVIS